MAASAAGAPEKDIEISVTDDVLTLCAGRGEQTAVKRRTEFRYGTYARAVRLPAGARWDETAARYTDGILTVTSRGGRRGSARLAPIDGRACARPHRSPGRASGREQ